MFIERVFTSLAVYFITLSCSYVSMCICNVYDMSTVGAFWWQGEGERGVPDVVGRGRMCTVCRW